MAWYADYQREISGSPVQSKSRKSPSFPPKATANPRSQNQVDKYLDTAWAGSRHTESCHPDATGTSRDVAAHKGDPACTGKLCPVRPPGRALLPWKQSA